MNTKNKSEEQYGFTHITKTVDAEKPHGEWNKVEIIADKDKCTHIINGKMVNDGTEVTSKKGRIIFQSEGAEIYFRNIELYPL